MLDKSEREELRRLWAKPASSDDVAQMLDAFPRLLDALDEAERKLAEAEETTIAERADAVERRKRRPWLTQ